MSNEQLQQQLERDGFVVIKGLLDKATVNHYISRMEALSDIDYAHDQASRNSLGKRGLDKSWSMPDGVTKTADFWPLIFNKELLDTVRGLLGDDIRYLQHSDLHVGFSAISWHRDNVCRTFNEGPDWNEEEAPYQVLRIGIYLQTYAESHFRLGFIPGSHKPQPSVGIGRRLNEAKLKWLGALSYVFVRFQEWASNATWIATEPGDCIIFDPRILHSGSYIIGPKYSVFLAYGVPNQHFYNHLNYYRHVRPELGYEGMPGELMHQLQSAGLYAHEVQQGGRIEKAWTPPTLMQHLIARQRKRFRESPAMPPSQPQP